MGMGVGFLTFEGSIMGVVEPEISVSYFCSIFVMMFM